MLVLVLVLACFSSPAEEGTKETKFFLPQNPVAAAYVLGRLSNQELIRAPRGEFVYTALLQRSGLEQKYRLEALEGLAQIRHTDQPTELLRGVTELDKKGEASTNVLQDLATILLKKSSVELAGKRSELEELSVKAQLPLTRQVGWASRIVANPNAADVWRQAQSAPNQLKDLLGAIPLVPEAALRQPFFEPSLDLAKATTAPDLLLAAAQALVTIPGHEKETFDTLATLAQASIQPLALAASLAKIPSAAWPTNGLEPLSEKLLQQLKAVPAEDRASPTFSSALQFETELTARFPREQGQRLSKELRALGPMLITLHAVYEQMRFDKTALVVESGKPVIITLQNDDAMPHNVAILAPDALKEVGQAAEKMPPEPDAQGRLYVPDSPKVLHATKLVAPGQKLELAFTAPAQPGDYPFTCTFPGHWLRMSGTMKVVEDLDKYVETHPQDQQPKLTEWKATDFAADLVQPQTLANPASGRELFSKLACVQCHKLGSQGYAYGPDLTDVFKRYKNDRAQVLLQILEPSAKIDERYRNYNFDLAGGESALGMILKEDDQSVTIQTGPADSLVQVIKKADIQKRRPQTSSPMPVGLLNALSKSEIFDLLAFLEAGGQVAGHEHNHSQANATGNH